MMRTIQAPKCLAGPTFDRAYWLSHCEGFRVDSVDGRLGYVEEVRADSSDDIVLAIRAGLLGRRIVLVSAHDVDFVVPRAERLWLHSPTRILGTEPGVSSR